MLMAFGQRHARVSQKPLHVLIRVEIGCKPGTRKTRKQKATEDAQVIKLLKIGTSVRIKGKTLWSIAKDSSIDKKRVIFNTRDIL